MNNAIQVERNAVLQAVMHRCSVSLSTIIRSLVAIPVVFIATIAPEAQAADYWTQKADFAGDFMRTGAVAFSIGDKGYVGMGAGADHVKRDLWEYDAAADVWTQLADLKGMPRWRAVGFSIGTKGYVGTGQNNEGYCKDFWEYDPVENQWTQRADFGGVARYGAVGFSIANKGYIGTGLSETYLKDFWEYDPEKDVWNQIADFKGNARYDAVGFSIGNYGYVGTGSKNYYPIFFKDFWQYDPETNKWVQKADFGGVARYGAVCFVINGKGYVGSGRNDNIYQFMRSDYWEYDPTTNNWLERSKKSGIGVVRAAGFSVNGKGYVVTGAAYLELVDDVWEYTPHTVTECLIPDGLKTTEITATSARLKWDAVEEAQQYKVRYKSAGAAEWTIVTDINAHSLIVSALMPETLYYWEVKSVCAANPVMSSEWSPKQSFITGTFRLSEEQGLTAEVYPNPVSDNFTLSLQCSTDASSTATVLLLNTAGQVVCVEKVTTGYGRLNKEFAMPPEVPSGLYVVRVILNDRVVETKLMYQK